MVGGILHSCRGAVWLLCWGPSLGARLILLFLLGSLGWPNDERNNGANEHDTGRDVEGEVVRAGYVRGDSQDQRAKEGSETPGGKHGPVDRPDVLGPEVLAGKGGHRAEAATIARQNDERENGKQEEHVPTQQWYQQEQHGLQEEHRQEDVSRADIVRKSGPAEPSRRVGDGQDNDKGRGEGRGGSAELGGNRLGVGDDRESGGHVQKEHGPQGVPLPRTKGTPEVARALLLLAALLLGGFVSFGAVALGRVCNEEARASDEEDVDKPQDTEGPEQPDGRNQVRGDRHGNRGSATKAHHRYAGGKAGPVREPL